VTIARRDFLKTAGGLSLATMSASITEAAPSDTVAGDDVNASLFDFADDRVPMNAANLCPMPRAVSNSMQSLQHELDVDMSGQNRRRIGAFKEDAKELIATMLGVSADELAIVRNTSEANNTIVQGLSLTAGDEVLIWDQNHPSNSVAWEVVAARYGCAVRKFSVPADAQSIDEVVDHVKREIGKNTRVLSFTHISNITGMRLPAAEICAAVKQDADIFVHVDGAQTWGAVDTNLREMGCDSFSASAHKWFMGPREVGLLYVKEENVDKIWPNIVTLPWGNEAQTSLVGARKFEALGQRDDAALAALLQAAEFHMAATPSGIEMRSAELAALVRNGLLELGLKLLSPTNPAFTSSVVIVPGEREQLIPLVGEILADSGVITAPVNGLRISPHIYNTEDHVDRLLSSVKKFRDQRLATAIA
jgi:isopenicillin-N epimerase